MAQSELFGYSSLQGAAEEYTVSGDTLSRTMRFGGNEHVTCLQPLTHPKSEAAQDELAASFDQAWLATRSRIEPSAVAPNSHIHAVDLFCGCGGFTLGIDEAVLALGGRAHIVLAADIDRTAETVYRENFDPSEFIADGVETVFDGVFGSAPTSTERAIKSQIGDVDILVGGPPCQGHSDLNNHTRRLDPKNMLYPVMARAAEILEPDLVIIENVPGARHDKTESVHSTYEHLADLGYSVDGKVIEAVKFGVPQTRKRYIIVASKLDTVNLSLDLSQYERRMRSVAWAIGDIEAVRSESVFDSSAQHSATNVQRINYLFDNELYDLPDTQRPPCHRDKRHSYNSVYGRMYWDRPAQTITTGFGSTGQGRFVHPRRRRTLTPHEAARIQFFPDFFNFGTSGRVGLQQLIGNAVPSKLGYVLGLAYLPSVLLKNIG